ncbi:hypothetical protein GN244_ATG10638 [Phytophthora infestans]|uniref:Uncharacterized protein n=1 Tax=Phytophthora infestans TaxID=4787 RepID=A0A833S0N6_PHYIN|nr:hypothetical protein GN244_ATG10638 [Phytophthora infestans]
MYDVNAFLTYSSDGLARVVELASLTDRQTTRTKRWAVVLMNVHIGGALLTFSKSRPERKQVFVGTPHASRWNCAEKKDLCSWIIPLFDLSLALIERVF